MAGRHNQAVIPGPNARRYVQRDRNVISPSYTRAYPFVMERGKGSEVWDVDGNRYVAFAAGIAAASTGHSHPKVVKAISDQAKRCLGGCELGYPCAQQIDLAEKLSGIAPMTGPKRVLLTNSGAESVEVALQVAGALTGRPHIIAFYGDFHGRTMGALSVTASKPIQRNGFSPLMPEVTHVPFSNPLRCPRHRQESECMANCVCVDFIEETVLGHKVAPEEVAAIIVEPIQGEGGYVFPQDRFLPKLRELCDRHGILLIADEVQSAIGRTGRWVAVEHWGVEPDIVCIAKGIASGMPLGAVIARSVTRKRGAEFPPSTSGGNPLSCAAALATLELVEKEFMQNAVRMGEVFIDELRAIQKRHPSIVRVEGRGLMIVADLAMGPASIGQRPALRDDVVERAFMKGVLLLGCGTSAIRFTPALSIPKGLVLEGLSMVDEALGEAEEASS